AGADINATDRDGSTALDLALQQGRSEIVQILLNAGAKPGTEEPVMAAALAGDAKTLEALSRAGYDLSRRSHGRDCPPLVIAAQALSKDAVRVLLRNGASA